MAHASPTAAPKVLIVDDGLVDRHKAGGIVTQALGWTVVYAENGASALSAIEREHPSVVLTDLQMPEMDGLELVESLRARSPALPVVLMTNHGSEEIAVRALRKGAASYVSKRDLAAGLEETLPLVLAAAEEGQKQQVLAQRCLQEAASHYVLENDPALVRALVSRLQTDFVGVGLCDDRRRLHAGIALEEALTNALYHGNLELSSDLRQSGDINAYHQAADDRRRTPPYQDRRIHVRAKLTPAEGEVRIRDEGPGFDPSKLPDPTDPENMLKASGRGLLLIRTFMDEVAFNSTGNEITMRLRADVRRGA
jgi:CheY-like chemotaxis protein/anti-sigma regulatory factor (Ser/Thr protein kinase)